MSNEVGNELGSAKKHRAVTWGIEAVQTGNMMQRRICLIENSLIFV